MNRYSNRIHNRHRDKERKNIILAVLFLVSIFMTLGYAAYQRDLIINAVGKIYSDWDVRFTDASCVLYNGNNDDFECHAYGTLETGADHLEKYDAGIEDKGDGLGGVVLHLYTEFASPDDYTEFEIEITNYSEMWDAILTSINYDVDVQRNAGDFILYDIDTLVVDDGTTLLGTILYTSDNPTKDNSITFKITAYWNPDLYNQKPDNTKEKKQEKSLYETLSEETYKEEQQILLVWTALAP